MSPDTCKERIDTSREGAELYEKSTELMRRIRQNFIDVLDKLKENENIRIIDANKSLEDIHKDILSAVEEV